MEHETLPHRRKLLQHRDFTLLGRERGGTAEFASRRIGKRGVIRKRLSNSRSRRLFGFLYQVRTVTDHIMTEDVMASEIEQFPDLSGFQKGDSPDVAAD